MLRIRAILLSLVAVFAVSAVAASGASAAKPAFIHCIKTEKGKDEYPTKKACEEGKEKGVEPKEWDRVEVAAGSSIGFTGKSGEGKLTGAGVTVVCKKDTNKGDITGPKQVESVFVVFTECEGEYSSKKCPANSAGAASGTIDTNELYGELGKVASGEATSEAGLDLKAVGASGNFVTIEGSCLPTTEVTGSIIGEVKKAGKGKATTTNELVYKKNGSGEQKIQEFTGVGKDTLKAFGLLEVQEETTDELTFAEAVEVT